LKRATQRLSQSTPPNGQTFWSWKIYPVIEDAAAGAAAKKVFGK
jgi:hypothetical protein